MRRVVLLGLAALAIVATPARHSSAQGLLHKHRHIAGPSLGAMRPLPAQASPGAIAATGDVASSDGAALATIAAVPSAPATAGGIPGAAGGAPGAMPICIATPVPLDGVPLDAVPMPMPSIDGGPTIGCPIDPSAGATYLPPTMFIGGRPGASGPPVGTGGVGIGTMSHGRPHAGRVPLMYGRAGGDSSLGPATALSANAFGQATAAATPPGRAVAAGLPDRAFGVRPTTLDVPGRRHMAPIAPVAADSFDAAAAAGTRQDPGVVQAVGGGPQHERASRTFGDAVRGATPAASAAAAPPRWRDRLRIAWPTTK